MSATHQVLLAGGGLGYQIPYSLRFRAANSAYLQRTPASAGNRKTWTWSAWVKRGTLGGAVAMNLFVGDRAGGTDATYTSITFTPSNQLAVGGSVTNWRITTAVFRDPTAWMHIVVALDTTQATAGDRVKVYVNGTQITAFGTSNNPALNADLGINQAALHALARDVAGGPTFFDGYMAEVNFIDGQALTPSSLGQTDATTGVWVPKKYSGTYGTNGFYLKFNDATTTTTIGNDSSGNANNWATSGISVTSGVTFDQMTDTPTLNYCVLNPLSKSVSGGSLKNANMTWNSGGGGATYYLVQSTFVLSGKSYWECVVPTTLTYHRPGIMRADQSPPSSGGTYWPGGSLGPADAVGYVSNDGDVYVGGSVVVAGATPSAGDIIQFAFNAATGELWVGRNGTWLNSGDPAAGTGEVTTVSLSFSWVAVMCDATTQDNEVNFGQRVFAYTPPSGFKALNTQNVTSTAVTLSGSFTGNAAADGPFIWANGNPATLTINGNGVTFGTHADKTAGGFKLRTSSASYNASGTNNWTATAGNRFVQSKRPNNGQVNP